MTTTLPRITTMTSVSALNRSLPGEGFLAEGKVIKVSFTSIVDYGIVSNSDAALSLEETIELIAQLSSALEKATTFTE